MSKLLDYLNELDSNANLKSAHDKDPEGTMKGYGLSEDECNAMLSGDRKRVAKVMGVSDQEVEIMTIHVKQF
ncbi:hypothetical protein FCL40_12340 [Ferrimonas sediminicola]|uniref:Extradiol ring-cleavage dioxygenase LigAB LigA subunit domain-containing protein n=1 Tax=Ferrimonas sediminicola TaxID=2569538 RepID=A0A4V5NUZ4_9GAMM|nr:hypothetical protein [Ferrimonas sediminicola]TKB48493.1 hypothetical protein FCL40_12340 [Ferrimonas sediminicola]